MSQQEIIQLLDRYLAGTATIPEQERVEAWLDSNEDLNNQWQQMDDGQRSQFLSSLYQRIKETIQPGKAPVVPLYRRKVFRYIAAACIILIASLLVTLSLTKGRQVTDNKTQVAQAHDIPAPTNTRAVITLADGSKVYLDSASNGTIAQENNVNVVKSTNGEIVYALSPAEGGNRGTKVPSEALNESSNNKRPGVDISYNTLFNPRGSKVISLTLSDGTKVWLNSESSLKYPIAFNSNTREVEITGEAYFEVKHSAKQPFKVHLPNGSVVEDIGTSFNVNAYTDEADIKTTLIEGSIAVSLSPAKTEATRRILKPGQQAVVTLRQAQGDNRILVQDNIDVDEVVAWKNGKFLFNKTDIQTTMRQISRWYDVDIEYRGEVKGGFIGSIPRKENVSQVLKMLEMTGAVHFQIEGKKIIVSK